MGDIMDKVLKQYDLTEIMLAKNSKDQEVFVYMHHNGWCYDIITEKSYEKKQLKMIKNIIEVLNIKGLSYALKTPKGVQRTSLPYDNIRNLIKLINKKNNLSSKEVEQIKEMSYTIACYVSYFLGFNIEHMPNLNVPLVKEGQITNILIPGTKLLKFRRELSAFIEVELYRVYNTAFNVCISCSDGMLDYRVKGILNKLQIDDTNITKNNHFSLTATVDTISVKGKNSLKPIVCIEPKGTKIKKLI